MSEPTIDAMEILDRLCPANTPEKVAARKQAGIESDIAEVLYDMRTAAGLSQCVLAEAIGVGVFVINDVEESDYEYDAASILNKVIDALRQAEKGYYLIKAHNVPMRGALAIYNTLGCEPNGMGSKGLSRFVPDYYPFLLPPLCLEAIGDWHDLEYFLAQGSRFVVDIRFAKMIVRAGKGYGPITRLRLFRIACVYFLGVRMFGGKCWGGEGR